MNKTVVIGIGNPLRGDDGVGWLVVEALQALAIDGVTAVSTHQLLPELIDLFRDAAQLIFIDASVVGQPGDTSQTAVLPAMEGPIASHQLHPGVLLALGVKLYGRMPPAYLITVTGSDFSHKETVSAEVESAISTVLTQIRQLANAKQLASIP